GNGDAIGGEEADGEGDGESDDDAEDAADERDEDGLGEELEADLAVGGGEHCGEILHAVNGFGAVAGLNYALDLWSGCDHHGGICHGEVGKTDGGCLHEIAGDGVWDQHRVVLDFRLAESFDALLEGSNHGEWQSGQFDDMANRS